MLTVILVANNTSAISQWDKKYETMIYEITKGREDLRDERNELVYQLNNLTSRMNALQDQYKVLTTSRDNLQQEVNRLKKNNTDIICKPGWLKFQNSCYYISDEEETKTWQDSRKDCQAKGADLVTLSSKAELDFVKRSYVLWIGLFRGEEENDWKWVDGTDLVGAGFWKRGEPNNSGGHEDCVEIAAGRWNDASCSARFSWVCEE